MTTKKLLLIDDNEDNRTLIKLALEMDTNWKILLAANGIEGIEQAESLKPDAILLDLMMPELDGLAVYDMLKSNLATSSIPIIFMTATTRKNVISQLEDTASAGILIKPLDMASLKSQIKKLCQWN